MGSLQSIAMRLFGSYFRRQRPKLPLMITDLVSGRVFVSVEGWLAKATLYSSVIAFYILVLVVAGDAILTKHILIITPLATQPFTEAAFVRLLVDTGIVALVVIFSFSLPFLGFIYYPQINSWQRRSQIDGLLPYAIGWMSTMVSVGVIPYITFKKLAEAEEYFGEVSKEAALVVRDVEMLGYDFISALRNLVETTPSTRMRVFVQGAVTNALSGGEMSDYFVSKARETSEESQKRFGDFIESLGLLSELYITMMVAAPLFMIVLYSAMMMLRGASPIVLMGIVYVFLPFGTLIFLLMCDIMAPQGKK